jgi:hypothetical protein
MSVVVPSALLCRWITSLMINEVEPPGISIGELTVTSVSNSPEAPKMPRRRNLLLTQERHRFYAKQPFEPALAIETLANMLLILPSA